MPVQKPPQPSPFRPVLLLVMAIAMIASYSLVQRKQESVEVPYSQFLKELREGDVQKVQLRSSNLLVELRPEKEGDKPKHIVISRLPGIDETQRLAELEKQGVEFNGKIEEESYLPMMVSGLLPFLLIGGLYYYFFRRMQKGMSGGSGPLSFGKNKAKIYDESHKTDTTFADVAGIDEAVDEMREVVDFLKNPQRYQALGAKIPKGVLLVGPPGTGKTLLAKAVAREAEANFIATKSSSLLSKWYGESERQVTRLFQRARQVAPTVIFIDEIDSLAPARGGGIGEPAVTERVVNTLLAEMDGLVELRGVVVIGASNRPTLLDPALLRPGRFDDLLYVPVPELAGRIHILRIHTRSMPLADDVDLDAVASRTDGYTGADLEDVVRRAGLHALRDQIDVERVSMRYFEEALKETRASVTEEMDREYREMVRTLKQDSARGGRIGFSIGEERPPLHEPPIAAAVRT